MKWRELVCFGLLVLAVGCVSSNAGVKAASGPVSEPVVMPRLPRDSGWTAPMPVGPIAAPGEIVEPVPGGVIDWGARVVRARGAGVLDPADENLSRARVMAERAAVVVAQRNLLEIIKGVRVDADTRVENFVTSYDVIYTRVEGVVKGARPAGPARYDSAAGVVEVELEVSLDGPQSVADALLPALESKAEAVSAQVSPAVQEFFRQYSGLVLDAGETGLKPALFPKIYDEQGNLLLDTRELYRYTGGRGQAMLNYIRQLDEILNRPEFSRVPLVVKIKAVRGRLGSDIVISRQDAERLKWLKDGAKFLYEAGRLIVRLLL